ncbi:MAG: metalloprotease TldD [Bradymonadales bacterium]|nr:metalloprotease TldD [Bradymonadales bacterium]
MTDPFFNRREFIKLASVGSAALACPGMLAGCSTTPPMDTAMPETPFFEWYDLDRSTLSGLLSELTSRGADIAEIFGQYTRATSISYEDGIINRARSVVDHGVGMRVVVGDQTGYAFTEDLTLPSMLQAARTASTIAHGSAAGAVAPFQVASTANYYPLDQPWSAVGIERKLPLIERVAQQAARLDPAVEKVLIGWVDEEEEVLIADIEGRIFTDTRPMTRLSCTVIARRDGQRQSSSSNIAARHGLAWYTPERLDFVAKQAVERTMALFEARRPPAGEMPLVLAAGASGILLHEAIGHGMEADFNRKGISIYADKIGQPIAPPFVTIVDDGTQPHERGALNVDDEGTPCQRTVLVSNGILTSYMHDKISARHYGVESTGSGRRQSFRHAPLPRMRSTYMENGPHTKEEIITSVRRGILAETFTNGQVQIGAGDFTFYIKNGWLIEDGRLTAPVKDCNIIGNGPEVLRNVTMVADDRTMDTGGWTCGKSGQMVPVSLGLPTVLVSRITVGGENA